MKLFRRFLIVLFCLLFLKSLPSESPSHIDSVSANISELITIINNGLGMEEARGFIRETKLKEIVLVQLEEIASKLNSDEGRCIFYMALANNFFDDSNLNDTQPLLIKTLELAEKIKNIKYQVVVYNMMANLFVETNMSMNSFQNFRRAIKLAEEIKDEDALCTIYANFSSALYRSWESGKSYLDSARIYNDKSLKLALKLNKQEEVHLAYQCLGLIETDAGNYKLAENAFRAALKLSKEIKVESLEYYTQYQLGRLFADQGALFADSAINYLNFARKAAYANEDKGVIGDILYEYARAYKNKGNYELSSEYALRFAEYNDSLVKFENSRIMAEMSEKYESVKNEAKISELNLIQQEKQAQINRQLYLIIGAIVVLILVGIVAFSLYRSNQIRKRVNKELNEKNVLIEMQKKEVEKQKEIVDTKNKAILDSIYYAKRIQQSLLPTQKYMERNLTKLKKDKNKT